MIFQFQNISDEKLESLRKLPKTPTSRITIVDKVKKIKPSQMKCEVLELVNIEYCDPKKIQVHSIFCRLVCLIIISVTLTSLFLYFIEFLLMNYPSSL